MTIRGRREGKKEKKAERGREIRRRDKRGRQGREAEKVYGASLAKHTHTRKKERER